MLIKSNFQTNVTEWDSWDHFGPLQTHTLNTMEKTLHKIPSLFRRTAIGNLTYMLRQDLPVNLSFSIMMIYILGNDC